MRLGYFGHEQIWKQSNIRNMYRKPDFAIASISLRNWSNEPPRFGQPIFMELEAASLRPNACDATTNKTDVIWTRQVALFPRIAICSVRSLAGRPHVKARVHPFTSGFHKIADRYPTFPSQNCRDLSGDDSRLWKS
jgi:hypothetical protein